MNRVMRTGKVRKANGGRTLAAGGGRKLARMREEHAAAAEIRCAFGAKRVGPLLKRLQLHLATQRFLAECRRDPVWRVGCDDAGLAIERLRLHMHPRTLGARTVRPVRNTRSGRR